MPPRRGFSLLGWLKGLFGGTPPAPAPRGRAGRVELGDQESRALADFSKQYGITFLDPGLLKLALTHRSYLHVTGQGPRDSNERLEFLGDSVLGLVTSEFLYRLHPGEHEGQLTKTKSLLVSKAILSRRALAMGLGRFVLMSHSEVESGGRQRLSILADAFESVIGAIYLDQGFEAAGAFIESWLLKDSRVIAADRRHTNYKSHLQEYVQSTYRTHPVYRIRSEMGPDHSKQFMVEVIVGRRALGQGRGPNKKEAEQAAARNAMEAVESGPLSDRETRRVERHLPHPASPGGTGSGPAPARPSAPESAGDLETADEGEDPGRPRRRGRRGGRNRRDRDDSPPTAMGTAAPAAPERAEPAPPERASARLARPGRVDRPARPGLRDRQERITSAPGVPSPTPAVRAAELEPLPPARDEDENEEVGRPEGPRNERHVDPFAWESPTTLPGTVSAPARPEPEGTCAVPERAAPTLFEAPSEPPRVESEPRDERSVGRGDEEDEGPRYPDTEPPSPPPVVPTWGRRGRRGR